MELPAEARRHLEHDQVAWLTTVTAKGTPAPVPVWFLPDGDTVVVFSEPQSRKVANISAQPRVTLHFNSDPAGQDIVVIAASAHVEPNIPPSTQPGYLDKYGSALATWGLTVEEFDRTTTTRLRLRPISVWLGPS
jgi:PPOX class probable F420-dependent enzyme